MALGTPTVLLQGNATSGVATSSFTPSADNLLVLLTRRFHTPAGAVSVTGQADGSGWVEVEDSADGVATGSERPIAIHVARSEASPSAGSITITTPAAVEFFLIEVPISGGGAWTASGIVDQTDWQTGYAGGAIPDFATTPDSLTIHGLYTHGGGGEPTAIEDTQLGTTILSNYDERAFVASYAANGNDTPSTTVASNVVWSAAIMEISDPAGAAPSLTNIDGDNNVFRGQTGVTVNMADAGGISTIDSATLGGVAVTNISYTAGQNTFTCDIPAGVPISADSTLVVNYTEA